MNLINMTEIIEEKIGIAMKSLDELGYETENISAKEFYDWMTGEIFSPDTTTLRDVLGSEYIMIHELVEISELKKMGRRIDKRVFMDSPKEMIYKAHFFAKEFEINYAVKKKDYFWMKMRLRHHKRVMGSDPNFPEALRPIGQRIYDKFLQVEREDPFRFYEIN